MPRKNRAYKRGEPYKDSTLFVIACEGAVREKEYFEFLSSYSTRVRIKVLEQEEHKSAPKWVLDCAAHYVEESKLNDGDQLWFVMDVDKWPEDQLRTIHEECEKNSNWFLALSNPCFETWLYMHVDDIQNSTSNNCQQLKQELSQKVKGGYNKFIFVPKIREAAARAKRLDNAPNHFIPEMMRTKMHLLSEQLLQFIGLNAGI